MNKRKILHNITAVAFVAFLGLWLSSCSTLFPGLVSGKWKDVKFSGENETMLEGSIWSYYNKSWEVNAEPLEVEFQSNGKVISSSNWRNASWERVGMNFKMVVNNGQNYFEGTYDPENNTILATNFSSDDSTSEVIMRFICKSGTGQIYNIGDRGPAGGIIFYDKGNSLLGWRYMEAAPVDLPNAQWGLLGTNVNVTTGSSSMGIGKQNTEHLIEALNRTGERRRAAQLCREYTLNDYNDWFLPSYDELLYLYNNLRRKGLGGFKNDLYWSSSQGDMMSMGTHNAFAKDFNTDTSPQFLGVYGKDMVCSVRAVRCVMER
jgi:hypothetical protein